jgi:hypothetical protein
MTIPRFVGVLIVAVGLLAGCRDKGYSRATPEDTLHTARLMVENGDARRLTELVYAESPEMRELLEQAGDVLASLADLGLAVQERFPKEVADLRAQAEAAAKEGRSASFLAQLTGLNARVNRAARTGDGQDAQELFNKVMMEVASDPYAWLTRTSDRVTVSPLTDDSAAIMIDGKPAMGVGLTLVERDGEWYLYVPVDLLRAAHVYPDSAEKWEMMGSLMATIDNAVVDMTADVRAGKARRLEDVARIAGEKAFVPAAIVMFAYGHQLEEERRARRAAAKNK